METPRGAAAIAASSSASDPSSHIPSLNDLCPELSSLQELACRGSWRSVTDKVSRARKLSLLHQPHHHVTYASYAVLALMKLRRFVDANTEMNSLGDLDSDGYRYETYPEVYPGRVGSMVPFSLRWVSAELPIKSGNRQEGIDRLYHLLGFVRAKLKEKEEKNLVESAGSWKKREAVVESSIIGHHLMAKEYSVCFSLIGDLMGRGHISVSALSKLGYLQMQMGDVEGSRSTFDRVERMAGEKEMVGSLGDVELENLVGRNRALLCLVGKDYVSAVREYDECICRDAGDVVAINNKAICLLYSRDLSDSIKVLENSLESSPTVALNETLVVNLCSMYELAYVNHSDIKRTLSNWLARVAPDDFDSSCTRT